jgi:predicted small lipoprotein YifL
MKRLLLCLTALAALVVLVGCGGTAPERDPLASGPLPPGPASTTPAAIARTAPAPEAAPPTVPTRLRLGAIDARVVPLALDGSVLTPPDDPHVLGWWGRRAGAPHGTTLLTGHTVHDGGGTFDDLERTPVGGHADVGGHSYRVTSVAVISKEQLARRAPALFAQTGRPRLVLVTCEDYDKATGHYASNVVVRLTPVR